MKVLGINCSPRKGGNTELLYRKFLKLLKKKVSKLSFFSSEEKRSMDV